MESVMQGKKECYVCGTTQNLECHHVISGYANRGNSERYGLKVWLCHEHHTGDTGVHFNKEFNLHLRQEAQRKFEELYGDRDKWRRKFGKSYL